MDSWINMLHYSSWIECSMKFYDHHVIINSFVVVCTILFRSCQHPTIIKLWRTDRITIIIIHANSVRSSFYVIELLIELWIRLICWQVQFNGFFVVKYFNAFRRLNGNLHLDTSQTQPKSKEHDVNLQAFFLQIGRTKQTTLKAIPQSEAYWIFRFSNIRS